ncbi:long-chain acyl-CoA synthetase [Natronorubrum sediminis]|uniref:Long-chain acyl-CoA synthetase n=1 Tax=Natronorubrum sediminis TaxID=640943 RepID=A0A1H6G509_9EURY|nr:AMP-binding protein [Natronorubrum sediminis]SEH18161.1 long-chain acyl-CoA synthetase [Natronorubrum sediminis]
MTDQSITHTTGGELRDPRITRVTAGDIVRRAGNRRPDKDAFVVPATDERVSFGEFDDRVNRAANAFLESGLASRDRLAIVAANSLEFLEAYFGALKAGLVVVPINPEITTDDVGYELDHASVDALVVEDTYYPKFEGVFEERDLETLAVIEWSDEGTVPVPEFRAFASEHDAAEPEVELEGSDLAQIMFTSGTTSRPKGVCLPHRALHAGSINNVVGGEVSRNDVKCGLLPMFHCAMLSQVKAVLHVSARMVILRGFEPNQFLECVETYAVTDVTLLPSMYTELLARDDIRDRDLSSLRRCTYAMTPIGNETLAECIEVFGAEFSLGSGQTEAYPPTCTYHPEWQLEKEGNYWGTALPNTDIAIMDDDGQLLSDGEVGEIVYRGPNVMDGYLENEERTREAFAHGWFHSGDVGYFDEDGLLKFVDRKTDMVKTGGENVSTQKVESVLLDHSDVDEVAVVGIPHERWGEAVTAFAVSYGDDPDPDDVLEYARGTLAGFETPKAVEFLAELPQTATSKVQKHVVSENHEDYYR